MKINPNWGVLEKWWAIQWASWKAEAYAMFHLTCRVYIENSWVEDRGNLDIRGSTTFHENVTYVAVVKGNILKNNLVVVKEYYGSPFTDLDMLNMRET